MTLRLIEGGRGDDRRTRAPDPRGRRGRDAGRRAAARRGAGRRRASSTRRPSAGRARPTRRSSRAGRAGSSAVGPRAAVEKRARGGRLRARAVRPPGRRRRRRDARARRSRTRTCCSPGRASRSWCCASVAPATSRSSPRAAGSCRRWRRRGRRPTEDLARARPALAGRDARARRHDDRGEVRLRPRPRHRAAPDRRRLAARPRGPDRRRADVPRRPRRPARVPRPPGRHGGLRPQRHRGADARASPRMVVPLRATCSASAACSRADQSRRILEAAAGLRDGARLHADELAPSGGAELAAELGALSADHLARAVSDEGVEALAAAAAASTRRSPRCCRRRPGSS